MRRARDSGPIATTGRNPGSFAPATDRTTIPRCRTRPLPGGASARAAPPCRGARGGLPALRRPLPRASEAAPRRARAWHDARRRVCMRRARRHVRPRPASQRRVRRSWAGPRWKSSAIRAMPLIVVQVYQKEDSPARSGLRRPARPRLGPTCSGEALTAVSSAPPSVGAMTRCDTALVPFRKARGNGR